MTPDLLEEGARRLEKVRQAAAQGKTESGGRAAGFSRVAQAGEVDVTHGRILYLEEVSVSFDGFKAINKLSLDIAPGEAFGAPNCLRFSYAAADDKLVEAIKRIKIALANLK